MLFEKITSNSGRATFNAKANCKESGKQKQEPKENKKKSTKKNYNKVTFWIASFRFSMIFRGIEW
jgi:hypothetical protein